MASISTHYGIPGPLEFLDVDVANDNRLFIDPRAVRLQSGPAPFAAQANRCTQTFFEEVVACVKSRSKAKEEEGLALLQRFGEPKETRLGMSASGFDGHGGGEDVGRWIWETLSGDLEALLRIGVLKLIEDVPVFVENVDRDITSDLTTRIIFEPLAKFTQAMVAKYPQFSAGTHTVAGFTRQIWDPAGLKWRDKELQLPVAEGKPLLLVPRDWARPRLLMSTGRFYETTMLSFVQEDRAVAHPKTGKLITEPKYSLKGRRKFSRAYETIVRVTLEAKDKHSDLLNRFRSFVDERYEPLDDEEIERYL